MCTRSSIIGEAVAEQGKAAGFMCAYPAINGVPCCGDPYLETQLMKETWGMGSSHGGGSYVQVRAKQSSLKCNMDCRKCIVVLHTLFCDNCVVLLHPSSICTYLAPAHLVINDSNPCTMLRHASAFMLPCAYFFTPTCCNALTSSYRRAALHLLPHSPQGDCGAIENIAGAHHYAVNNTYGAAIALNAGTDVDCGNGFTPNLAHAIKMGLTTESELDASLVRTYTLQMLAGRFDPPALQPYMQIPFEAIDSPAHQALAFESGLQGMVLLRNDASLLPLAVSTGGSPRTIAVIGPLGDSHDLAGNYYEEICAGGVQTCVPTLRESVLALVGSTGGTSVTYALGCNVTGNDASAIASAVAVASSADVVILALGTNSAVAQEGDDRADTSLPGVQAALSRAILAAGKPTVVIMLNGGTMGVDDIVNHKNGTQRVAIIEAFFPGQVSTRLASRSSRRSSRGR